MSFPRLDLGSVAILTRTYVHTYEIQALPPEQARPYGNAVHFISAAAFVPLKSRVVLRTMPLLCNHAIVLRSFYDCSIVVPQSFGHSAGIDILYI